MPFNVFRQSQSIPVRKTIIANHQIKVRFCKLVFEFLEIFRDRNVTTPRLKNAGSAGAYQHIVIHHQDTQIIQPVVLRHRNNWRMHRFRQQLIHAEHTRHRNGKG